MDHTGGGKLPPPTHTQRFASDVYYHTRVEIKFYAILSLKMPMRIYMS